MKIAFDGRVAQRPAHSYRRVLELLVLAAREVDLDYEVWTDGALHSECSDLDDCVRPFPASDEKTDVKVVWTPTPHVPNGGDALTVSTVCDVNPLLPDGRNIVARLYRARRFRGSVSRLGAASWRVATDSEDACKRLAGEFPACADKLRVVPLSAHPCVRRLPDGQRDALLRELGLDAGYILFVGSFRRHKNWIGLMQAYAMCPRSLREDHPLVFCGPVRRDRRRAVQRMTSLGIGESVRIVGETPERYMAALYSGAVLFVFPTFMEGFGLPPLEAMQCGVPVIASNRTAVPEVLGDAARYIDPAQPADLAVAIEEVLAAPDTLARMATDGLARAAQFGPRRTGEAILRVLEESNRSDGNTDKP
jgi:glycosyltransferase involved in cell wall biosynthesis